MTTSQPRRGPTPTVNNHYVPEWYQKRFLRSGETKFHYLDLKPDRIPGAPNKRRSSLLRWGPARCFKQEHLYTLKFGRWMTDMIERGFFQKIDDEGLIGVKFFADYDLKDGFDEAWHGIMAFMDAQRFRTPRGLDNLRLMTNMGDKNALLMAMRAVFQYHATMWSEGIWEILSACESPTKFLLTDNPVTFYNQRAFPGSPFCQPPRDALLEWVGTRTIFPLSMDRCLIISHRELTRNPWKNPLADRVNARAYQSTLFNALEIQTGRQLEEDEVRRINLILKKRADRYIAAADPTWLYPEQTASMTHWSKIDHDWFLFPNLFELHMGGTVLVGYEDGSSAGWDAYGRPREHSDFEKPQPNEAKLHHLAQREWGLRRIGKSIGYSDKLTRRGRTGWEGYMRDQVLAYAADKAKKKGGRRRDKLARR